MNSNHAMCCYYPVFALLRFWTGRDGNNFFRLFWNSVYCIPGTAYRLTLLQLAASGGSGLRRWEYLAGHSTTRFGIHLKRLCLHSYLLPHFSMVLFWLVALRPYRYCTPNTQAQWKRTTIYYSTICFNPDKGFSHFCINIIGRDSYLCCEFSCKMQRNSCIVLLKSQILIYIS